MRYLLALISAALIVPSILLFRESDLSAAQAFVKKYNLETRRPDIAETVGYAPSTDWAAEIVADAALRDAYEPVNLLNVTPEVREAWIRAAGQVDNELRDARAQLLDAIAARPGWPFYQSLLGQTVFAIESRSFSPDLVEKPETWSLALLNAAHGAPAAASPWRSLAAAYLQTWPVLAKTHSATAHEVFAHAFADPEFVRAAFPDAARLLGPARAVTYVPDAPQSLTAAFNFFAKTNDIADAWPIRQRWERAEWADRTNDLADIDRHAKRGDFDDVRNLCDRWTALHPVWDFDTPAAHAQAARILDVWPGGRRAEWSNDRIAELAKYLISRDADGDRYMPVVAKQIDSFASVPAETIAEVKLRAGDVNGAERIAQSAEDAGSLSWSRYLLTLASLYKDRLPEVMKRISPAALETHEARIVRGIAAEGGGAPLGGAPQQRCGRSTEIAVHGDGKVVATVNVSAPSIVDISVNRARAASLLVDGSRDVTFTLTGWRDKTIGTRTLAGDNNACLTVQQ